MKAPWGYGDNFDLQRLSSSAPLLYELANRLCSQQRIHNLDIGNLRDITVNFRHNGMFKLDPHIDPLADGGHVFIVGLKADVVLTLTPDLNQLESILSPSDTTATAIADDGVKKKNSAPKLRVRMTEEAIALGSWSDLDIDILLRKGVLLHLRGSARYQWKHAIRTGVVVDAETQEGERRPVICDWWGDINSLIPRKMDRVSVIFAFK